MQLVRLMFPFGFWNFTMAPGWTETLGWGGGGGNHWDLFKNRYEQLHQTLKGNEENLALLARHFQYLYILLR